MSTYLLIIQGNVQQEFCVGALGYVTMPPGCYLYAGSARRGLHARLARHLRQEKKRRWHIDYVLSGHALTIQEIWIGEQIGECQLAGSLLALPRVTIPKLRLGASDCRCLTHFCRYDDKLSRLKQHLASLGFMTYVPA
jgi:Uri superfamily endonuclease